MQIVITTTGFPPDMIQACVPHSIHIIFIILSWKREMFGAITDIIYTNSDTRLHARSHGENNTLTHNPGPAATMITPFEWIFFTEISIWRCKNVGTGNILRLRQNTAILQMLFSRYFFNKVVAFDFAEVRADGSKWQCKMPCIIMTS